MEIEAAMDFFGELFSGVHNIPAKIYPFGDGWCLNAWSDFATFDGDRLTRLVFLAHDNCVRAEIRPSGPGRIKICIWQREIRSDNVQDGRFYQRHPTLEQALKLWRKYHPAITEKPHPGAEGGEDE